MEKLKDTSGSTNEKSGSAKLLSELQLIFEIYANDLKVFRTGEGELELLHNSEMFDTVVKLLNVSDKIKKLDTVDEETEEDKPEPKVKNLQDFVLKNKNK